MPSSSDARGAASGRGRSWSADHGSGVRARRWHRKSPAVTSLDYDFSGTDPSNNPLGGTGPEGESFSVAYYAASASDPLARYRPRSVTDTEGRSQFFGYDGKGNLTDVKDSDTTPFNQATLAYHANGVLASATDGNGNKTSYSESGGNITTITPPTGLGQIVLTYDALNRVRTLRDGEGRLRTLSYDKLDRLVSIAYDSGPTWTFTYDATGNITRREEGITGPPWTTYAYDKLSRRTNESSSDGTEFNYTYDKSGNLATLGERGTLSPMTYSYDDVDRVTRMDDGLTRVDFSYDDANRKVTRTFPGATHETTVDRSGKTKLIAFRPAAGNGSAALKTLSYDYTEVVGGASKNRSMIRSITREDGRKSIYEYGRVGEVTKMRRLSGTGSLTRELTYTYDKALNRLSRTKVEAGVTTTKYFAYTPFNAICAEGASPNPSCAGPPSPGLTYPEYSIYGYDKNGNRTGGPASSMFDMQQRVQIFNGTTVEHLGPTNGEMSKWGDRPLRRNLLGLASVGGSNSDWNYLRDPEGNPIAYRLGTSAAKFFLTDHQNSPISVYTPNSLGTGQFVGDALYEPDGVTTNPSSERAQLGFAGGLELQQTAYHFGRRFYDTRSAQWTQPDPLEHIADLTQANRYNYVGGNGVNYTDPTGTVSVRGVSQAVGRCNKGAIAGAYVGAGTGAAGGAIAGSTAGGAGAVPGATAGAVGGAITGGVGGCVGGVLRVEERVGKFLDKVNPFDD